MTVKVSLQLGWCNKAMAQYPITVKLAGMLLAKRMLAEVAFACYEDATVAVRTTVL